MTRTDMREIVETRCGLHAHLPVNVVVHTQYGPGARGIEWIRNKVGDDPETIVFPLYDGHGNMVYTLSRGGNETFSLGNKRIYGAWGDLRYDGNPGDGPNTQYCANLGHKLDDESGLTYMRARYYEPWTGRFINEDPARDGWNWYGYCDNEPISIVDFNGKNPTHEFWKWLVFDFGFRIIFGRINVDNLYYRIVKAIIGNLLDGMATLQIVVAAGSLDAKVRAAATNLSGAVTIAMFAASAHQMMLLMILIEMDIPGHREIFEELWGDQVGFTVIP